MSPDRLTLEVPANEAPLRASPELVRLEALVREHHAFTWRVLRRLGLSPPDADDAAQRVFLIVSERLSDITPGSERAFLFRVASHVASKAHRSRRRRPEAPGLEGAEEADLRPGPDVLLDQRRARDLLDVMLAELPEELRSVFVLFDVEGLTKGEVALALGIPEGTVASRLRRARAEITASVQRAQARARFRGVRP